MICLGRYFCGIMESILSLVPSIILPLNQDKNLGILYHL